MGKSVSIVIPVYNEEDYLRACLDSVANQTQAPKEVIVVDNNSSDNSVEICMSYPFVKVITEPKQGIVHARNAGFEAAKGEIIARVDADSILPHDWIGKIESFFAEEKHVDGLTGKPRFYNASFLGLADSLQVLLYQRLQKLMTGTYILWGANMALRHEAWDKAKHNCSTRTDIDEDIDLSFCIHENGLKIKYMPGLRMGVSLQRGQWTTGHTVKYLATWPRDYWLHKMYVRGMLIVVVVGFLELLSLPALLFYSAKSRLG